jgi:hypothetical protein
MALLPGGLPGLEALTDASLGAHQGNFIDQLVGYCYGRFLLLAVEV